MVNRDLRQGISDGIGIAVGYFTISIAFGLFCAKGGVSPLLSGLMSFTNLSSSGQFAAINIMVSVGSLLEIAMTVALVNLRYVLMSVSLAQRLAPMSGPKRALLAWGVTDEIYAVAMGRNQVGFGYYVGLMSLPIAGWTTGTVVGAFAGEVLPPSAQSAAGILLYGMFIAIVVPPARDDGKIRSVVFLAAAVSLASWWLPIDTGWKIILATCVAAALGATFWPVEENT